MFARGGRREPGVGVKRLGRRQVPVHRAWCSASCTAGPSQCCCPCVFFRRREGQGLGKRESLQETWWECVRGEAGGKDAG